VETTLAGKRAGQAAFPPTRLRKASAGEALDERYWAGAGFGFGLAPFVPLASFAAFFFAAGFAAGVPGAAGGFLQAVA
jgi:hypothetical protein